MSLDKSRIPKRGNSSRKFIPEKQRKTMTDPFVDWIKRTRSDKEGMVSGRMVETRSQKTSVLVGETGMQRAHQQLRRDSPELCHG